MMHLIKYLLVISFSVAAVAQKQPAAYLGYSCSNETTFVRNSTYQTNLNNLLSSLSSNANNSLGFYNTSSGRHSDAVHGLFLCQGDISTVNCEKCVTLAAQGIVARCPIEKEAIIWYDVCFLRYSNRSFFSSIETDPSLSMKNEQNISDPTSFGVLMAKTMNDGAVEASTAPPGAKKIAVKEANLTGFQPTLYTLMQCTGDLSNSDCLQCLLIIIAYMPSYCGGKQGGRLMTPSCYARFEVYSFYNATAVQRKPPPPPPSPELPPPPAPLTSGATLHAQGNSTYPFKGSLISPSFYQLCRNSRSNLLIRQKQ